VGELLEATAFRHPELAEQRAVALLPPARIEGPNRPLEVSSGGVVRKAGLVVDEADARLHPRLARQVVEAEDLDLAGVPGDQVHHELDDRRLPGPVRSDEPHHVAARHRERDLVEGEAGPDLAEAMDLQREFRHDSSS
jgi:hypothetical protein